MAEPSKHTINNEYKWYAVYTRQNHEKKVEELLQEKNIEVFLPKRKTLRKWSDRKKWVEEPLFRPYVFVNISNKEYFKVLQTPSVKNYICFEGRAAQIQDNQIELLKRIISEKFDFEIYHNPIYATQKVKVIQGPFYGQSGEVEKKNGKSRFLIKIDQLNCSIIIDIDQKCIVPL